MNKITRPNYDDANAFTCLANNPRVLSFPNLKNFVADIQNAYVQYVTVKGNVFSINPVCVTPEVESYLKSHYKSPPNCLGHIKKIREKSDHLVCPMCGSMHSGTLDHLLPQDGYEAFAIYSLNLVPACKCNSLRNNLVKGQNPGERILHPYFDECLADRLIKARFDDLGLVPSIKLCLCIDNTHPEYIAINFHLRSIVERTSILRYLHEKWANFCSKPSLIIRELKQNPSTLEELNTILNEELKLLDETHKGKNNWNSIFVAGLLDERVLKWLFQQLNNQGRSPDTALI